MVASTPHSPDPSFGDWHPSTGVAISHRPVVSICPSRTRSSSLLSSDLLLSLNRQSVVSSEGAVDRLVVVLGGLCDLLAELVECTDVLLGRGGGVLAIEGGLAAVVWGGVLRLVHRHLLEDGVDFWVLEEECGREC